jgi:hypothetical protein
MKNKAYTEMTPAERIQYRIAQNKLMEQKITSGRSSVVLKGGRRHPLPPLGASLALAGK